MRKGSHITEEHKARINIIRRGHISLIDGCPEVAEQWDYTRNELTPSDISVGSSIEVWWKCSSGHSWKSKVSNRTYKKGRGCPICKGRGKYNINKLYIRKVSFENSILVTHPKIAQEWDSIKNYPLTVDGISAGSNRKVWWKCNLGHQWAARVNNRAGRNQNCCPICGWQSSKLQLFIYCEIKHFYKDAEYRQKLNGIECDIYIPSCKVAIEIDGGKWHQDSYVKDNNKVSMLNKNRIIVIRIREGMLKSTNGFVVRYKRNEDYFKVAKSLMLLMQRITLNENLKVYENLKSPINSNLFNFESSRYPLCCGKLTLAEHNPELCKSWDYEKNYPLTPDKVAPKSNMRVWWIINNKNYFSQICQRNKLSIDKSKKVVYPFN
jgi:hypothetical protein